METKKKLIESTREQPLLDHLHIGIHPIDIVFYIFDSVSLHTHGYF